VVWRAEYEPYGSVYAYRAGDDGDPQALRLPGQEAADPIVGQEYNIFRWYRSEWGRYTQAAPLAVGGLGIFAHGRFERYTIPNIRRSEEHADAVKEWGVGVFSYAAGNPVGVTDSVGLKALKCKVSTIKSSPNRTNPREVCHAWRMSLDLQSVGLWGHVWNNLYSILFLLSQEMTFEAHGDAPIWYDPATTGWDCTPWTPIYRTKEGPLDGDL